MLVSPLSSHNTRLLSHRLLQVLEKMAHTWAFPLVMTMLCEVPRGQVCPSEVLTLDLTKRLAGHYLHAG
jgi:hypothetical protein